MNKFVTLIAMLYFSGLQIAFADTTQKVGDECYGIAIGDKKSKREDAMFGDVDQTITVLGVNAASGMVTIDIENKYTGINMTDQYKKEVPCSVYMR